MNNEHAVIHEFDFSLTGEFFKDLERQGPASEDVTKLALYLAGALNKDVQIADIGCGTGGQTFLLAKHTKGTIQASDLMPAFIESLRKRLEKSEYKNRISFKLQSMFELPYADESFDLLWAEGSIYHIGFQRGLKEFRRFLKPSGMIAVSEVSWFTDSRPEEISSFWQDNYPEIDTISNKVKQMEKAGYKAIAHFVLPEESWWNYFNPITAHIDEFLEAYPNNNEAQGLVEMLKGEIALYDKYKDHYGYVFYIGQKI